MSRRRRRIISIAHSYCVALNRRLANEMARVGGEDWEITAVAPAFFRGDLRPIELERSGGELCRLEAVPTYLSGRIHWFVYGYRLRSLLRDSWDLVHCWRSPTSWREGRSHGGRRSEFGWRFRPCKTFPSVTRRRSPRSKNIASSAAPDGWGAVGWWSRRWSREATATNLIGSYRWCGPRSISTGSRGARDRKNSPRMAGRGTSGGGYMGRFVPEKGLSLLMRALDRIATPWRALFVGGGAMDTSIRQWAARYGERVRIVNNVAHDEVTAYLNAMDLLCAPSQTAPHWREQFGRMVAEAFACGVPVIASDSGELPYVVDDAGLIVAEHDEDEWVRRIGELIDDSARRAELSRKGIERARSLYAWPVVARAHLEFFSRLLDGEHP